MRIGQFAIFTGTNASTVRYYEQIGLLPPPKRVRGSQRSLERRMRRGLGSSCVAARWGSHWGKYVNLRRSLRGVAARRMNAGKSFTLG